MNSHLKTANTNTSTSWFKAYKNAKNSSNKKGKLFWNGDFNLVKFIFFHLIAITKDDMLLVKYFISSETALNELDNPSFVRILNQADIKVPDKRTFKTKTLKEAYDKVKEKIEDKLYEAEIICIIFDIWSNNAKDYMGCSAAIGSKMLEKECFVIGIDRMSGGHTAENVKATLEKIINRYSFDKTKIKGNF